MSLRRLAPWTAWLFAGACALVEARAPAFGFALKVDPIPITMADGATSTMAEVTNEGDSPLRVQAQSFDWTVDPAGKETTTPSGEILIFPSMLSIPAHSSRKVRVGTQGGYAASEKCFRVVFAEIPNDTVQSTDGNAGVKVVAHVSVPVFVKPPGAKGVIQVDKVTAFKDHVQVSVRNTGTAHVMIHHLRVEALGAGGKTIASGELPGWYVLPGMPRQFDVDFAKAGLNCAGAKQLVVTAIPQLGVASASAVLDNPECAGP